MRVWGLPGVKWAAGGWGGGVGGGGRKVGMGDFLVTQGLATLLSAWTFPEDSVGSRCPWVMLLASGTQTEPRTSLARVLWSLGQTVGPMVCSPSSPKADFEAVRSVVHSPRPYAAPPGSLWGGKSC